MGTASSAATAVLLQPKRQPPAIQIDTLIDSSSRTALFEKNKLISMAVYSSAPIFVEVRTRIKIVIKFQHFCNGRLVSLKGMSIDKNKIKTQDELDEPAPMDKADARVEAEMKKLEKQAKKDVAEGLQQQEGGDE